MKVKELLAKLLEFDPEMQIVSQGTDCGGYDAIMTPHIEVYEQDVQYMWSGASGIYLYVGGKNE